MDTHRFRPASLADLPGLVELLRACDGADIGSVESTSEDVRWRWRTDGFDLGNDTFVMTEAGAPTAYGFVFEGEAEGRVHPARRGEGIGTALLGAIERRAARQGSPDGLLRQNVTSLDTGGLALLKRHGYAESHHYTRMEIALDRPVEIPPMPEDVALARLSRGEERDVYEAYVEAWAQYAPSWRDEGFERWSAVFEESDFDPRLWFIARRNGRVVAFNQTLVYPELGWIQMLGTVPSERGSGLGELLLRTALAEFRTRGLRRAGLTVSSRNLPAARRLYCRTGFRETLRYINLAKRVASGDPRKD